MDWPEVIEDEDDDFPEVLYTEEEAAAILHEWSLRVELARLHAAEALRDMARAVQACREAVASIRDNAILSQSDIG
jgi:hypothetical protein